MKLYVKTYKPRGRKPGYFELSGGVFKNNIERNNYGTIHSWLGRKLGKARYCCFCGCNSNRRFQWALLKGLKHERRITNYIPLCQSCHKKYDYTEKQKEVLRIYKTGNIAPNRKPVVQLDKTTRAFINRYDSMAHAGKALNRHYANLVRAIRHNKTFAGYRWEYETPVQ